MKSKRSRLALIGVLALAMTVMVGLVSGGVADAAKKKKKKSPNTVTVSNTTPRAIPDRPPGPDTQDGRLDTTFNVGKKFRGKTVDSVALKIQTTGDAVQASDDLQFDITAPNGYRLPGDWWDNSIGNTQSVGPLTITPNSPFRTCTDITPPIICSDPYRTVLPPYVGTVGDNVFNWLRGVPMRGTWTVTALDDDDTNTSVLNQVSLTITAQRPIQ